MAAGTIQERAAAIQEELRAYLQITWIDSTTVLRVQSLTEDGIAYIDRLMGEPGDYESPGHPRTLLKEYVRYARDEALDVFVANYIGLINELQNDRRVSTYELDGAKEAESQGIPGL